MSFIGKSHTPVGKLYNKNYVVEDRKRTKKKKKKSRGEGEGERERNGLP